MKDNNEIRPNGDDFICAYLMRFWEFTYHCIMKFGFPVAFDWRRCDVPRKVDDYAFFYIPKDIPEADKTKIKDYIIQEFGPDRKKGIKTSSHSVS